jgi:hypothetical protein
MPEEVFFYSWRALLVLFWVACWGAIFRKAGYSFWWGLVGIIPIIPLLWLAFATWPIEREMRGFRVDTGQTREEDGYALLDEGARHEHRGRFEEARAIYERVATQWPETAVAQDARLALDALQERMQAPGSPVSQE